ncbi:MAG: tetratricopeptide repeat-containing sulfotransferase family protein [Acidiferrobacterales bacterium]
MTRKNILLRAKQRKAEALLHDHRLWEAKAAYQELCEADRLNAEAWVRLGIINRQLGLFPESERCARQALTVRPDHAAAQHALGAALQDQGRLAEALSCYRAALHLQPDLFEAHYFLANALREQGQLDEAVSQYRHAVRLKPDFLEALSNLGAALRELGQYPEALKVLHRARRIDPHSVRVQCNLGGTLSSLNRPEEALPYFDAAIAIDPEFFDAWLGRGNALRHLGRFDEALASFRAALELRPDAPVVIAGMAEILEMRGELTAAEALIRPLIEADSSHPRVLTIYAALARDADAREAAASILEKHLSRGSVDQAGQPHLHFALGKLYDAERDYDKAFGHYGLANQKIRIQEQETFRRCDPAGQTRQVRAWMEAPRGFWTGLTRATNDDERPVFVVGMQRSGTTLAEQILASHPAVHGAGELRDLGHIADALRETLGSDAAYPQCLAAATPGMLDDLARRYLERLDALSPGAARVVDKMPGNFQRLGLISVLFPKARVIHMMRDPLDTCLSIYFQKFNTTNAYAFDLADLGAHYQAYRALMRYWRETLFIPMLEIQYEALAAKPEEYIPKMIAFCGLDWDARCLRFHELRRDVNTPSYEQVRQPMYTRSIGRWKHYERHLGPLIEALREEP